MLAAVFAVISYAAALQFQNAQTGQCLQANGPANTLSLAKCNSVDSQSIFLMSKKQHESGKLFTSVPNYCVDIAPGRDNQTVISLHCADAQPWQIAPTPKGTFTIQQTNFEGVDLCLEPSGAKVDVYTCDETLPDQFWKYFN
ncbi:hypothetical protein HDV01_005465 [Terramyces sp. JEL0728]|nr:hypothetical protein HDV01_005465 [Terramyces sp. JEL0728]